jgi:putative transcription antitermination factor YqgF
MMAHIDVLFGFSCLAWQPQRLFAWKKFSSRISPPTSFHTLLFLQADSQDNRDTDPPTAAASVDSSKSLSFGVDQIQFSQRERESSSSSSSKNPFGRSNMDSHLVDAAAAVTQQSCQLLGVKSVGVDYGLVRTGLAATVGYSPKPLAILSDLNSTEVCHQVIKHCKAEQASQIIVGLPLHKNGTEAEQTNVTRIFATELATIALQTLGPKVPVYMWDERYTSKEAAARAHSHDPNRWLHGTLDADAACIILEHYYNSNGKDAHQVLPPKEVQEECIRVWEIARNREEESLRAAMEQRQGGRTLKRQEAMERARQLEAEMAKDGILGQSRKQKKKKNRKKRGPWLVPGKTDDS